MTKTQLSETANTKSENTEGLLLWLLILVVGEAGFYAEYRRQRALVKNNSGFQHVYVRGTCNIKSEHPGRSRVT